jgi:hypothetical protein
MGRAIVVIGVVLVAVGLLMHYGVPIGRLPGDISYKRGNFSVYLPLTTSLLASIVLTLVFWLLNRR